MREWPSPDWDSFCSDRKLFIRLHIYHISRLCFSPLINVSFKTCSLASHIIHLIETQSGRRLWAAVAAYTRLSSFLDELCVKSLKIPDQQALQLFRNKRPESQVHACDLLKMLCQVYSEPGCPAAPFTKLSVCGCVMSVTALTQWLLWCWLRNRFDPSGPKLLDCFDELITFDCYWCISLQRVF